VLKMFLSINALDFLIIKSKIFDFWLWSEIKKIIATLTDIENTIYMRQ
jgi:hypothetical protein